MVQNSGDTAMKRLFVMRHKGVVALVLYNVGTGGPSYKPRTAIGNGGGGGKRKEIVRDVQLNTSLVLFASESLMPSNTQIIAQRKIVVVHALPEFKHRRRREGQLVLKK